MTFMLHIYYPTFTSRVGQGGGGAEGDKAAKQVTTVRVRVETARYYLGELRTLSNRDCGD